MNLFTAGLCRNKARKYFTAQQPHAIGVCTALTAVTDNNRHLQMKTDTAHKWSISLLWIFEIPKFSKVLTRLPLTSLTVVFHLHGAKERLRN